MTNEQTEPLLPCPFCGEPPVRLSPGINPETVQCRNDNCPANPSAPNAALWNTRASPPPIPLEDEVERLTIDFYASRQYDPKAIWPTVKAAIAFTIASLRLDRRGALEDIAVERRRQYEVEGWSIEHDDEHIDGSIALAAAAYAVGDTSTTYRPDIHWPWDGAPKRGNRRRELIKAGALIVAEIERLDRAALSSTSDGGSDEGK